MGSPEEGEGRENTEVQHYVILTKGFWIGRYPVTQGEYEAVKGNNPSCFTEIGPRAPVEMVSWEDAVEFCKKLSELDQREYSLPTT